MDKHKNLWSNYCIRNHHLGPKRLSQSNLTCNFCFCLEIPTLSSQAASFPDSCRQFWAIWSCVYPSPTMAMLRSTRIYYKGLPFRIFIDKIINPYSSLSGHVYVRKQYRNWVLEDFFGTRWDKWCMSPKIHGTLKFRCFFGYLKLASWWFQPIWKILVKLSNWIISPRIGVNIKNISNHHLARFRPFDSSLRPKFPGECHLRNFQSRQHVGGHWFRTVHFGS